MDKTIDQVYAERDMCIALLAWIAIRHSWTVWRGITSEFEEGWQNAIYIMLPTGQISWHFKDEELEWFKDIPFSSMPWDRHTTEIKYARILELIGE